jgi:hypothetical protein
VLHHFESDAVHLEFFDSLVADIMYLLPVAENVEGGVHHLNPMQRESKVVNKLLASTSHPGRKNPVIYLQRTLSLGE